MPVGNKGASAVSNPSRVLFCNPETVIAPLGAYSHVGIVPSGSRLLVIAGQVGITREGVVPPEPEEQYALALRNLVLILESQGASTRDLVKLNTYAVRPINLEAARRIRIEILGDVAPAATFVYVARLVRDDFLMEVEGWAVAPEHGGPSQETD
jgi:2-iminobutanoate/2-iminopropanoate deaminase